MIPKTRDHLSFAALTCGMACLGAYLGGTRQPMPDDYYRTVAWQWHQESHRLLEQMPSWRDHPNQDLLRLYMLEVTYMTILQKQDETSRNMTIAIDLAFALQLHNEAVWYDLDRHEQEHNRMLWWTLCFMDSRFAMLSGRRILIRAADFAVGLPTAGTQSERLREGSMEKPAPATDDQPLGLHWHEPSARSKAWSSYAVFIAQWSSLVGDTWDRMFSPKHSVRYDTMLEDIAFVDVLLLQLRNELPAHLLWDSIQLPNMMPLGGVDRLFRMRLIIFEAINMLRIRIRTGKTSRQRMETSTALIVAPEQQPLRTIDGIASDLIDAIALYLGCRKRLRPWSTYGSILLIAVASQLLPHLANLVTTPQYLNNGQRQAMSSIAMAQKSLRGVEVKHATYASECLSALLQKAYDVSLSKMPMTISPILEVPEQALQHRMPVTSGFVQSIFADTED